MLIWNNLFSQKMVVISNMFVRTRAVDKILQMKARKKVIQGGSSAGKTFAILAILIDMAAKKPNLEISVVSESVPHLRKGALKDFKKIMKSTNRWRENHFNYTQLTYTFGNSSYIEFFSANDSQKVRGPRRNVLYVNEADNVPYAAYLELSIRTNKDIFIDFNPTSKFWAHTEVLQEDDSEFLKINYLDNDALDETTIKTLHQNRDKGKTSDYWANWWKVYGLGELGVLQGAVYHNWSRIDKIPEEATLLAYGCDFGFSNDVTAVIGVYKLDGKLILHELVYQKGLTISELSNILKSYNVVEEIIADSSEPRSIKELRNFGFRCVATKKGKDSVNYGISLLQDYELLVTKSSENLHEELMRYKWKQDKSGETLNTPIDAWNHGLDAVRYVALTNLSKTTHESGVPFRL